MRPEPGRRLHVGSLALATVGTEVELDKAAQQHARVLRLKSGARIELFDGQGRLATAELMMKSAKIHEVVQQPPEKRRVGLLQGLPKGSKSDDIVRMATELGATDILFVHTHRAATRAGSGDKKTERWKRIALEATRQCERLYLPNIQLIASLEDALDEVPRESERYFAWARHEASAEAPRIRARDDSQAWIAVGPEGGFADDERAQFEHAGFRPMSLGRHILRVDTAACAALTLLANAS